jgi:hypothetical protein
MTEKSGTMKKLIRALSYSLQGISVLFLGLGAINNLLRTEVALANAQVFGYSENTLSPLAWLLLVCLVLYLIPRTAILGAILITAWLGGAIATHTIHADTLLFFVLPILFAVMVWTALLLRSSAARSIFLLGR